MRRLGLGPDRATALHVGVLVVLLALHFVLPDYHHISIARIMVLACFAMGYNIAFGYSGLLSLGHAMFFAAGLYGAGLAAQFLDVPATGGLLIGILGALALVITFGAVALRTTGVSFMIVTLMFAQAVFLIIYYFGEFTRGDEGFIVPDAMRAAFGYALNEPTARYLVAFGLFAVCLIISLAIARSGLGRVLVAIRENEDRARMLGYDIYRMKLLALLISGGMAGAAGAVYAMLFGYVGATFASIEYSILPLLWVLVGGAGTVLGPFVGTLAMFYLIDITSGLTTAYLLVVGLALIGLVLFFPKGILGTIRERWASWLP
jgi:branched-chain amino acid transport system permease protein